ncbi:MAG: single-stranded-DNA-specific exonuclease RecJ [bacterium]|nr:single-stranded-DNA-specific exonuclease RecJ [bacterium]
MSREPWITRPADPDRIALLADTLGVTPLLARLLVGRGVDDVPAARRYLGLDPCELDPWALPGVHEAANRLVQALDRQEPVLVYGDYDADGVTSTTLLYGYLARSGYNAHYFLPHRFEDGYGMNRQALDNLAARGFRLVVTVDNGVAAVEEVRHARSLGMEVIVTDHHTPPEVLPEPHVLINPRLGGCPPEMAGLAGVGVAYTLACALEQMVPGSGVDDLLDLVALGSIADVAPLVGVNRTLVTRGLHRMATRPRPGIQALADVSRMSSLAAITAMDVGFRIAPRINAAGRMEHAETALKLLLAETLRDARIHADQLELINQRRQDVSRQIEAEAHAMLDRVAQDEVIVLASEDWHRGILGIVAARLMDATQRPVILLGADGGSWKGSGRSPAPINLCQALESCRHLLQKFGGHAQAVGVTLERSRLEEFRLALAEAIRAQSVDWRAISTPVVDAELTLGELTPEVVRDLERLQPTGQGNPEPVFGIRDVQVHHQGTRGAERQVLYLELQDDTVLREAVGFRMGALHPVPDRVSVRVTPEFNHFRNQARLQLRLHEVQGVEAPAVLRV